MTQLFQAFLSNYNVMSVFVRVEFLPLYYAQCVIEAAELMLFSASIHLVSANSMPLSFESKFYS
jgi:hypothetical protein